MSSTLATDWNQIISSRLISLQIVIKFCRFITKTLGAFIVKLVNSIINHLAAITIKFTFLKLILTKQCTLRNYSFDVYLSKRNFSQLGSGLRLTINKCFISTSLIINENYLPPRIDIIGVKLDAFRTMIFDLQVNFETQACNILTHFK